MKLEDLLNDCSEAMHEDVHLYSVNGNIKPDHDKDFIRLYVNPADHFSYFLIRKNEIIGEVYKWTSEELLQFGFIGEEMHRIKLRHGTKIQSIEIAIESIGETIEGNIMYNNASPPVNGNCRSAKGCGNKRCCTEHGAKCSCDDCCIG